MSFLKKAFLLLALLGIVGVAGTEAVLWLFFPHPDYPPTGNTFQQDMPGVRPRVEYELNEQQLRTLGWDAAGKKEGAKRVLFLGGISTDNCIHAVEDTWWGLATKRVIEKTGLEVEAACMGTLGSEIIPGAKWYRENLEELSVDLLVVSFGLGDVLQDGSEYRYDPDKFDRLSQDRRPAWKRFAGERSQIYRRLRAAKLKAVSESVARTMGRQDFFSTMLLEWRREYARLPYAEEVRREATHDPLLEYLDGIDRLIELCRLTDTGLLMLGEPVLHDALLGMDELLLFRYPIRTGPGQADLSRPNPAWVSRELDRFYDAAKARCEEEGVPFYSLKPRVPRTREYFVDDNLLTLKGCETVAGLVTPAVTALLTGSEAPSTPGGGER